MNKVLTVVLLLTVALFAQTFIDSKGDRKAPDSSQVVVQVQPATLRNSTATGGTNAAVTASIAAVTGQSVRLFSVNASCSAGTATVTIKDGVGGTTVWLTPAAASTSLTFYTPLSSTAASGMDIVLAACGAGNTGTLRVQASQF